MACGSSTEVASRGAPRPLRLRALRLLSLRSSAPFSSCVSPDSRRELFLRRKNRCQNFQLISPLAAWSCAARASCFETRIPNSRSSIPAARRVGGDRTRLLGLAHWWLGHRRHPLTFRAGCRNAATPVTTNARHGNEPMTSKAPDSTTFRFSTADWPEQDRLAIWREAVGRSVIQLDTDRLSDGAFHAEATVHALPGL